MMYLSVIFAMVFVFILSAVGTAVLSIIFNFLGKQGYLGNLYPNVRGGIPRGIGLVPFIILSFYLLPKFNNLVLIIGVFAFIDDILGRKKFAPLGIEWGQLSRGIGIVLVMIVGIMEGLGVSAILIALMVQPMNISDMQPGSTCIVTIIMSVLTMGIMLLINSQPAGELLAIYTPLLILVVCLGYCPLDFSGKIMMGDTLKVFFRQRLGLINPTFGDYFMDVLTGGGLGDLVRKYVLKENQYPVTSPLLISLGFRRLLYNPYARRHPDYHNDDVKPRIMLRR